MSDLKMDSCDKVRKRGSLTNSIEPLLCLQPNSLSGFHDLHEPVILSAYPLNKQNGGSVGPIIGSVKVSIARKEDNGKGKEPWLPGMTNQVIGQSMELGQALIPPDEGKGKHSISGWNSVDPAESAAIDATPDEMKRPSRSSLLDITAGCAKDPFESYLNELEDIHWDHASHSVASVVGKMLGTVTKLNDHVDSHLADDDGSVHDALRMEIHSELTEINGLMKDYVARHPSIVHSSEDEILIQLRELGYDIGTGPNSTCDHTSQTGDDQPLQDDGFH